MKFLCDRCKTRYSIGDDRVRGKILKIRCKNCANVITVREGMADADDAAGGERRSRPTTGAPMTTEDPAPGALGAAFASQLAKPPPALEQEWYVSIEGAQSGPYSLPEAQRWVTGKPFDAELHCWSEGFDDWLAVDKVSHFRGLRKRPAMKATTPPPIPRVPTRPAAAATPAEDEPKPLFAATMASIEKTASAAAAARTLPTAPTRPSSPSAKANGTGVSAPISGTGSTPAIPKPAARSGNTNPPLTTGAAALAAAFKVDDAADSMTAVEAPAFRDEIAAAAEPVAAKRDAAEAKPGVKPIFSDHDGDDDDGLSIGEVSRVVKLTDLAAMAKPKPQRASTSGAQPLARATGLTGSVTKLSPSELGMKVDPSLAAMSPEGEPHADESVVARSFAQRHRRGMVLLISVSAMMVLGVIAAVAFFASGGGGDELPSGLGGARVIDTSRPEDIVRKQLPPAPNASNNVAIQKPRWTPRPQGSNVIPEDPGSGNRLESTEIEAMAAKQGEGTKRCYMRAQKGAMGFEIADVKKIEVTLTINKTGSVSDVQLSSNSGNSFGQCLITRIKAWKFRESAGGTFRISLAFSS